MDRNLRFASCLFALTLALTLTSCESPQEYVERVGPYSPPERSRYERYGEPPSSPRVIPASYTPSSHYSVAQSAPVSPPEPPVQSIESQADREVRIAVQLGVAVLTKVGMRPAEGDDAFDALGKQAVDYGADMVIESSINEGFPYESWAVRRAMIHIICALAEGDYELSSVPLRLGKSAFLDWLSQEDPALAQNVEIGDFMYSLFQRF